LGGRVLTIRIKMSVLVAVRLEIAQDLDALRIKIKTNALVV
jgi:hypothetical protein